MVKPRVHVRLKGRLGNQLFQFWIAKYVSMCTGLPLSVFSGVDVGAFIYFFKTNIQTYEKHVAKNARKMISEKGMSRHANT